MLRGLPPGPSTGIAAFANPASGAFGAGWEVRTAGPSAFPTTVPLVDIEEFYEADPRRRSSAEIELGREWRDEHDVRYELNWVEDTKELYVMREPVPYEWATPFGGVHVRGTHDVDQAEVDGMTVSVLGTVDSRDELERILDGWEEAMAGDDSVSWLVDRLRGKGVLGPAGPNPPLTA